MSTIKCSEQIGKIFLKIKDHTHNIVTLTYAEKQGYRYPRKPNDMTRIHLV